MAPGQRAGKGQSMNVMERQAPTASQTADVRVAVADARRLIAEALASMVDDGDGFEVVAVAAGEIRAAALADPQPDLVLLGVGSDLAGSLSLIDALAPLAPRAQVVIVADAASRELVAAVLERSLGGLLLTDHPAQDLVSSLRHIAHGQAVLPAGWQAMLSTPTSRPVDSLSERQLEVLRLLADGCSYEEIGRRLFISVNTVKFHTRSIFERLGVRNRMAAARILAESGSR
jgi:DNA-binding NarL/FixJ family response regulator